MNLTFRKCDITGFKIEDRTASLVKWNIVTAIIFLFLGGAFALLVGLTRWPSVHLLSVEWYYRALTAHGFNALLVWILFFEMAVIYVTSAVFLNTRTTIPFVGWVAYGLMLMGAVIVNITVLAGKADVMFTSYVPLQASGAYYMGIILFAVGCITGFGHFFANIIIAKSEGKYKRTLPLVTFGVAAACIIGVLTMAHGAVIMIPTYLWSIGLIEHADPATYRLVFWGLGHPSQQINVCIMVSLWYMVAALMFKAKPLSQKLSRGAFVLYILFINVASEHHLLVDPVLSSWHKVINTSYVMHLAVFASMIHAFAIPGAIENALRKQGYNNGLFEWLKKAPWGNPVFSSTFISIMLFGFLGGITGVTFGTEQFNIIRHNTIAITGHFHGTVVAGTTICFMGATYYFIPMFFRRKVIGGIFATLQPYVYAVGVFMISMAMMSAGSFGVPRRHWDYNFSGAPFGGHKFDPIVDVFMSLTGVGVVVAAIGGAMFIVIALGSIMYGEKLVTTDKEV